MARTRAVLIVPSLLLLVGAVLYRMLGADAVPIIGVTTIVLALIGWSQRQARLKAIRRAAVRLRPFTAAERSAAVASVESEELRDDIAAAVTRQGTETRDGAVERFPLPAVFRARAVRKFWIAWALGAAALAVAAFAGDLAPSWRVTWLGLGCLLALHARRKIRLGVFAAFEIEITPFRLSLLGPEEIAQTLSFADGIRLEDRPGDAMLIVRSGDVAIPVSYHLIGVRRLIRLVKTYGNVPSGSSSPAR